MIVHKIRKFCPECHSEFIRRVHRGFIKKHMLRQRPKYKCDSCETIFFTALFENDLKKTPKDIRRIGDDKQAEYEEIEIIVEKTEYSSSL